MADDRTVDDILGPRKDPPISMDDIEKVTSEKAKGDIKDSNFRNLFKESIKRIIDLEAIQAKAGNRDTTKNFSPLSVETINTGSEPERDEDEKEGQEHGE